MAGSLKLIQKETITSGVSTVTLTGIDSTYDVYMIRVSNVQPVTDNKNMNCQITKSGVAQSDANYDYAFKTLKANTSFGNVGVTNATQFTFADSLGNGTGETVNAIMYLFNFANASEYSFMTVESARLNLTPDFTAHQGGIVHTVASASDGIKFFMESSVNMNTGAEFALYGLKK